MTKVEKRLEKRTPLRSATLPLLASREEDFQPFQYLVQDLSINGVRIAIPSWVQSRERLYTGDVVNLHLPYRLHGKSKNQGTVAWGNWDARTQTQTCGISLDRHFPETYPVYISLETRQAVINLSLMQNVKNVLLKVLKDTVLLKKGLLIYMGHLVTYLARVSKFSKRQYADFREIVIDDIQSELRNNLEYLEKIYSLALAAKSEHEILDQLDIDEIRGKIESELYVDIFSSVLDSEVIQRYLVALKTLEKKGYNNYNTLVILYQESL